MTLHIDCHPFYPMGSDGFWTITQPSGLEVCQAPGDVGEEHPLALFQPNTDWLREKESKLFWGKCNSVEQSCNIAQEAQDFYLQPFSLQDKESKKRRIL